jgi:hypothetical protein
MPIYLQAVDIPERCYLDEVLLWVAFQRLPTVLYDDRGQEVRETTEAGGLIIEEFPYWEISEEETKRANIPPDPTFLALIQDKTTLPPVFFDDLLKRYGDPEPDERAHIVQKRAEAEIYQRECAAWQPYFEQAIEYPASCIFVALKGGKLGATGRLLPGRNMGEAHECLEREDKDVFDFSVEEIPASFWSLSGMDFKSSAAGNGLNYYCHVGCRTADVLSLFPGEREPVTGIERVGGSFVLNETASKPPKPSNRGRPAYPWEPFHVEVAALLQRGELPSKKEAAIQHFQNWFHTTLGVEPSRAAIGARLKPYYDKFGRQDGQKI